MKVGFDAIGAVTIFPEGAVEDYALRKWWEDWQASRALLTVCFYSDGGSREEIIRLPEPEGATPEEVLEYWRQRALSAEKKATPALHPYQEGRDERG